MSVAIPDEPTDRIVETEGVLGGQPRINGTRIGVLHIANLVFHEKYTLEEVHYEIYPELTGRDVAEALLYYLLRDGTMMSKDYRLRNPVEGAITGPDELPNSSDE